MDFSSEKSSKRTSLTTKTGETLVSAAEKGDTNALRSLLKANVKINRMLALNVAAGKGHLEAVNLLLRKGADVNARDDHGNTALLEAARGGHVKVLEVVHKAGANFMERGNFGATALHVAALNGKHQAAAVLVDNCGALVDTQQNDGCTALHLAAWTKQRRVVEVLLQKETNHFHKGVSVDIKNTNGKTALDLTPDRCTSNVEHRPPLETGGLRERGSGHHEEISSGLAVSPRLPLVLSPVPQQARRVDYRNVKRAGYGRPPRVSAVDTAFFDTFQEKGPSIPACDSVDCPICFEIPRSLFCCQTCDNAVCGDCVGKVSSCPMCRQDFQEKPPLRNKYAERMLLGTRDKSRPVT